MEKPSIINVVEIINSCIENAVITESNYEDSLIELGVDSIEFIAIIVELEKTFNIEFPDDRLSILELESVSKIIQVICEILED